MTTVLTITLILLVPVLEIVFAGSQLTILAESRLIYVAGLILILSRHPRLGMGLILTGSLFVELATFRPVAGLDAMSFFVAAAITFAMFRFSSFLSQENTYLQVALIFLLSLIVRHVFLTASDQQSDQLAMLSLTVNSVILVFALFVHARLRQPENAFKT